MLVLSRSALVALIALSILWRSSCFTLHDWRIESRCGLWSLATGQPIVVALGERSPDMARQPGGAQARDAAHEAVIIPQPSAPRAIPPRQIPTFATTTSTATMDLMPPLTSATTTTMTAVQGIAPGVMCRTIHGSTMSCTNNTGQTIYWSTGSGNITFTEQ